MGSGSNDDKSINEVGGSVAIGSPADAVDHLYGLAPTEFVTARNELAKTARAAGERELAADIKAMRKPSVLAAELNRILRLDQDRLQALLQAALALRDGHQSVLAGEEVDLVGLQGAHREAAASLAAPAEAHRDRLQAILEATSLDIACHDDLQRAAYVTEPAPALGFDLFNPQLAPDAADSNATATVSSISQARTRKRRREAENRQQAPRSKQKQKSSLPIDPTAETETDAGAEAEAKARRAEAESALADASSAHGRAEASLTLAYRQAEAAAKKHAKATERLSEAERQLSEATSQLTKADKALNKAKERSDAAEQLLSSTADTLREAQARMKAESPDASP